MMSVDATDFSSEVVHKSAMILTACRSALEKLEPYLVTTDVRPDIAHELLRMLSAADDLLELASPSPDPAEYHGMPREYTASAEKPAVRFRNSAGWDFLPWYGEKVERTKAAVKHAIRYWETDPAEVKLREDAPMTPREWVRELLLSSLHEVNVNAEKIFSMFCRDQVYATGGPSSS